MSDGKECGQNRRGKRYHRANSYDETFFSKHLANLKSDFYGRSTFNPSYVQTSHLPPVYSSTFAYGPFYNQNDNTPIANVPKPDDIYRSSPMLNYAANSYFGWHKGLATMPRQQQRSSKPTVTFDHPADTVQYRSTLRLNNGMSNCFDKDCLGSSSSNDLVNTHSPFSSLDSEQLPTRDGVSRKSRRIKLCVVLSILVIIVAVLIAMGVAVYSQGNFVQLT